jgi:hypothetical protein
MTNQLSSGALASPFAQFVPLGQTGQRFVGLVQSPVPLPDLPAKLAGGDNSMSWTASTFSIATRMASSLI